MTISEAREAVYARFVAQWGGTTAYYFDNEDDTDHPDSASWVKVSMRILSSEQTSIGGPGNRRFTHKGLILVEIFTLMNTGIGGADALFETVKGIFDSVTFDGVESLATTMRSGGQTGTRNLAVVETPCHFYEVR